MSRSPALAVRNLGLKAWRRLRGAHKPLVRLARRQSRQGEQAEALRDVGAIERELARLAASGRPIIAGPWLAEVGYEALYWVPFLRWFQNTYRVRRERIVVLSRGGVHEWYRDVAGSYAEIFDLLTPDALATRNETRRHDVEGAGRKQTAVSTLDDDLLRMTRERRGSGDVEVLHPSLMFRLFRHVWHGSLAYDYLWTHTRYALVTSEAVLPEELPREFTAVKLYAGTALPPEPWVRDRLRELVAQQASVRPVVLLDTGVSVDEHEDYRFADIPNVLSARRWMTPATNLGVQTALVARARLFLGTCGGVAWLAPFLGTPAVAVYADDRQLAPHLYAARQAGHAAGAAEFLPLDLRAEARIGR